jgi:Pyruvate/2-oxoacid:ferredoxin oxidoreductase gamma subunit
VLDGALHQWFPIPKDRLILELFGNQLVVNFVVVAAAAAAAAVVVVVVVSIRFEDFWNPSSEGLSFEDEGGRYCSVF